MCCESSSNVGGAEEDEAGEPTKHDRVGELQSGNGHGTDGSVSIAAAGEVGVVGVVKMCECEEERGCKDEFDARYAREEEEWEEG